MLVYKNIFKESAFSFNTSNWMTIYKSDSEIMSLVKDATLLKDSFEGNAYSQQTNLDCSVMALLSGENSLYIASDNSSSLVANDIVSFELSLSGSKIAYINEDAALILYDFKSNDTIQIADEVEKFGLALSPDGKSVAYVLEESDKYVLYVYNNGQSTKIGNNLITIGISNSAKYILP